MGDPQVARAAGSIGTTRGAVYTAGQQAAGQGGARARAHRAAHVSVLLARRVDDAVLVPIEGFTFWINSWL